MRISPIICCAAIALCGCASQIDWQTDPAYGLNVDNSSAAYTQGRRDALDELRSQGVWEKPFVGCKDEVSWVNHDLGQPTWGSRETDFKLLDRCRTNAIYNAKLIKAQRQAVESAK